MKRAFIFILVIAIAANSFAQQNDSLKSLAKTDYLQKSNHQKTAAWVMLVGGVALATAGGIIVANQPVFGPSQGSGGEVLFVAGIGVAAASIPFFIVGAKNKGRALSASFKMESAPSIQRSSIAARSFPAMSLKISL
ncbi:MAG TPA: hypothetical protein VFP87_09365 [Chitinophagaceae bacterium]|nr:hypothetical protein [Chitinophagaceae bacterium]